VRQTRWAIANIYLVFALNVCQNWIEGAIK